MKGEDNTLRDDLKQTVSLLPELPGIYQYFNSEGKIIYVGKAKNLREKGIILFL